MLLHGVHAGTGRSLGKEVAHGGDSGGGSAEVNLHGPVVAIAHRARQAEPGGLGADPPAESHALHPAPNPVRRVGHRYRFSRWLGARCTVWPVAENDPDERELPALPPPCTRSIRFSSMPPPAPVM